MSDKKAHVTGSGRPPGAHSAYTESPISANPASRTDSDGTDSRETEIFHLRALNRIAEHLNRSADVRSQVEGALEILRVVLNAKAAWAYLWAEAGIQVPNRECDHKAHDFALVGCLGLPGGWQNGKCNHLCEPPDCACQKMVRSGKIDRGVNVVKCTRLDGLGGEPRSGEHSLHHATVPLVSQSGRLGVINVAKGDWGWLSEPDLQLLTAAGFQIGTAIERAQSYETAARYRAQLSEELDLARRVQKRLFPKALPLVTGYDIAAEWRPAREMAGDFYDLFELPNDRWGIVVADVSGKGVPAALYMTMIRSLIRSEAVRHDEPSPVLTAINDRLLKDSLANMFVTVFYGVFDPTEHLLTYCIAGHDPPLLRGTNRGVERLPYGGCLLGIFDEVDLESREFEFKPGESLVIFTDGVTEAVDGNSEEYGLTRLSGAIGIGPAGAQEMISHLIGELSQFSNGTPQADDITLFVLNRQ